MEALEPSSTCSRSASGRRARTRSGRGAPCSGSRASWTPPGGTEAVAGLRVELYGSLALDRRGPPHRLRRFCLASSGHEPETVPVDQIGGFLAALAARREAELAGRAVALTRGRTSSSPHARAPAGPRERDAGAWPGWWTGPSGRGRTHRRRWLRAPRARPRAARSSPPTPSPTRARSRRAAALVRVRRPPHRRHAGRANERAWRAAETRGRACSRSWRSCARASGAAATPTASCRAASTRRAARRRRAAAPGGGGDARAPLPDANGAPWQRIRAGCYTFGQTRRWVAAPSRAPSTRRTPACGRVVTAPTNGAAGVIPAVLDARTSAFPTRRRPRPTCSTFSSWPARWGPSSRRARPSRPAMGGCQAEIGVSSAMAAAALCEALGVRRRRRSRRPRSPWSTTSA